MRLSVQPHTCEPVILHQEGDKNFKRSPQSCHTELLQVCVRSEVSARLILMDQLIFKAHLQANVPRDPGHPHPASDRSGILLERRAALWIWEAGQKAGVVWSGLRPPGGKKPLHIPPPAALISLPLPRTRVQSTECYSKHPSAQVVKVLESKLGNSPKIHNGLLMYTWSPRVPHTHNPVPPELVILTTDQHLGVGPCTDYFRGIISFNLYNSPLRQISLSPSNR